MARAMLAEGRGACGDSNINSPARLEGLAKRFVAFNGAVGRVNETPYDKWRECVHCTDIYSKPLQIGPGQMAWLESELKDAQVMTSRVKSSIESRENGD